MELPNYLSKHQIETNRKAGFQSKVSIYIDKLYGFRGKDNIWQNYRAIRIFLNFVGDRTKYAIQYFKWATKWSVRNFQDFLKLFILKL